MAILSAVIFWPRSLDQGWDLQAFEAVYGEPAFQGRYHRGADWSAALERVRQRIIKILKAYLFHDFSRRDPFVARPSPNKSNDGRLKMSGSINYGHRMGGRSGLQPFRPCHEFVLFSRRGALPLPLKCIHAGWVDVSTLRRRPPALHF